MPHYVRHDKGGGRGCLAFARHDKGKRHDKRRKVWQKEKGRTKEGMTEEGRGRTLKFPL